MEPTITTDKLTDPLAGLTTRERAFVYSFCQYRNAAKAARDAGYSERSAKEIGYKNITKVHIQAAISSLMEQHGMSVGECIGRLTAWGRGTMEPFLTDAGELTISTPDAIENRHLIKKVRQKKTVRRIDEVIEEETTTEIELHDPKDAVDKMLQLHGRYKQLPGDANQPKALQSYQLPDGTMITF